MKRALLIIFTLITIANLAMAQTKQDDPFKKMDEAYKDRLDRMNQQYEANLKRMQEEYDARLQKMNAAFKKHLKKGFTEVDQTEEKVKPVEVPKPIKQPAYKPVIVEVKPTEKLDPVSVPEAQPAAVKPTIVIAEAAAYSIAPILQIPEGSESYQTTVNVDFFGSQASLKIDNRTKNLNLSHVKPNAFASYWDDFTSMYYQIYIESVLGFAEEKNLNDWGIYQLIDQTAKSLFTSSNNRTMWIWAILNQVGYQAKIGYSGQSVYLLLPFMQEVYEKPYYYVDGSNFYLMSNKKSVQNLMTYQQNFDGATKKIDLHLPFALNFTDPANSVVRQTTLPGESEPLKLQMDKTIMKFLTSYPQTVNTVYLNGAMSSTVKETLYEYLTPRLEGKSETQAITYLLNYLHHSFEYKTDREQFNKEKMFFPDEIFYYPYSDCEDRTVLFTRLANELLGLDAVALTYFSHMAAAVAFTEPVEGYSLLVDGRRYTITDPTYINAPIGSVMPEYEKYQPLAIKINNDSRLSNIWQMIARSVEKGNEGRLFIGDRSVAENGKFLLSGWFTNDITIDDKAYSATGGTRDLWFASFDQGGSLEWFLPLNCTDNAFSQAFNVGKKGNVYALINYTGTINVNRLSLARSEHPAHLILGISNQSNPILSENLSFEIPEGKKLAFYGKYKPDGTKVDLVSFPTDKVRFEPRITIDSQNDIVVRGIVGEIEGLTKEVPINLSSATFSAENQISSNINTYRQVDMNQQMIALYSALELLAQNGGRISGITIRNLFNEHQPEFYKQHPDLYKNLLSLQFVMNDGGVVKVETYQGRDVSLLGIKIRNNSNLQIVKPTDTSFQIKFLNGAEMRKAALWYPLNSVIFEADGQLLFDYNSDHSKGVAHLDDLLK
jgi:hypothetical protein